MFQKYFRADGKTFNVSLYYYDKTLQDMCVCMCVCVLNIAHLCIMATYSWPIDLLHVAANTLY